MIILIFGKQQEIWEVELDWRDIFPVRRLSGEPVWHELNASRPPLGTGKQLCHSIAAPIRSDREEAGGPAPHGAKLQRPAEVKAHRSTPSKSSRLLSHRYVHTHVSSSGNQSFLNFFQTCTLNSNKSFNEDCEAFLNYHSSWNKPQDRLHTRHSKHSSW